MRTPIEDAKEQALRYLAFRSRSGCEILRYLAGKGYSAAVQQEILHWLEHLGYIDDLRFAGQWIENRCRTKPMGARRLAQELRQKGIPRPVIDEALAHNQIAHRENALAKALALKQAPRYQGQDVAAISRRLAGFLQRRGFGFEDVKQAVEEALAVLDLP